MQHHTSFFVKGKYHSSPSPSQDECRTSVHSSKLRFCKASRGIMMFIVPLSKKLIIHLSS